MSYQLAWGTKVSSSFKERLHEMVRRFGWTELHASWIMSCMAFESAGTFKSDIKNFAGSGATGLIQFMPATARGLGTTVESLAVMTPTQQLEFVEKYFRPYHKRIASLSDMYMAILLPKYVGQPDDAVLFSDGVAYRQNAGLDANKDGKVTKAEATSKVVQKYREGLKYATHEPDIYPA